MAIGGQPISATLTVHNQCDHARVDARFWPLIKDVTASYTEIFAERMLDIRLQGTVARGEAVIGQSDIDFMALLDRHPSEEEIGRLEQCRAVLRTRYPIVSRVELDVASLDGLTPFQRFVLSSDSLSVYGTDHLTRHEQRIDRAELALMVTPDAAEMIANYRALMRDVGNDADTVHFYGRIVAKDLLKCVRGLALLRGGPYEVSVERMVRHVARFVPELAGLANRLLALYRVPPADPGMVLTAIDETELGLLPLLQSADL